MAPQLTPKCFGQKLGLGEGTGPRDHAHQTRLEPEFGLPGRSSRDDTPKPHFWPKYVFCLKLKIWWGTPSVYPRVPPEFGLPRRPPLAPSRAPPGPPSESLNPYIKGTNVGERRKKKKKEERRKKNAATESGPQPIHTHRS